MHVSRNVVRPDTGYSDMDASVAPSLYRLSMGSMATTAVRASFATTSQRGLLEPLDDKPPTQLLSGIKLALAIASLDILVFISALDPTIVATVYVPIGDSFDSMGSAEWIVTSYLITVTAFQPLYGRISDLLGRLEAIVFSILVFLLGSVLCATSTSMNMLIASRAVQGIGGAGMVSLALIVMADIMNERQRSKYIGVFSGTFGLASAIAPVIGGAIVSTSKWQVVFWINVPFCVIALLMITMLLRVPKPRGSVKEKISQIDVIGALLSLAGITLLLLGLSWGGREYPWLSPQVICALAFGGILLVLFVLYEWKIPVAPIVPIRLFRIRNFAVSSAASLLFGFAINGATLFIPQWALVVRNTSEITAGAYLLSFCVGMVLSSVICGIVVSKTGRCREAIVVGSALLLLGNCLLLTLDTQGVAKVIGFLFIGGLGVGCCMQPISLIGQASVSGQDMASSTTTFLFFRSLGMVLAVSVLSNVIQNMPHEQATDIAQQFPASASLIARILKNTSLLYTPNVPANLQLAIIEAYSKSIHMAFIVLAAFTGVHFILALGFKHVELKTVLKPTIS